MSKEPATIGRTAIGKLQGMVSVSKVGEAADFPVDSEHIYGASDFSSQSYPNSFFKEVERCCLTGGSGSWASWVCAGRGQHGQRGRQAQLGWVDARARLTFASSPGPSKLPCLTTWEHTPISDIPQPLLPAAFREDHRRHPPDPWVLRRHGHHRRLPVCGPSQKGRR